MAVVIVVRWLLKFLMNFFFLSSLLLFPNSDIFLNGKEITTACDF